MLPVIIYKQMRRMLFSYPVAMALIWLALGVWAYGLEKEPASALYGVRWLPVPQNAATLKACR